MNSLVDIHFLPVIGVRLTGDHISFSADNDKYKAVLAGFNPGSGASDFSIDGGRIGVLSFAVNGKLGLPAPFFRRI